MLYILLPYLKLVNAIIVFFAAKKQLSLAALSHCYHRYCSTNSLFYTLFDSPQFDQIKRLNIAFFGSDFMFYRFNDAVKLCVVDGQQTMIYHDTFAQSKPDVFAELQVLALDAGWVLLEDRRKVSVDVDVDRRHRVLFVSIKLLASTLFMHNASVVANELSTATQVRGQVVYASSIHGASSIVNRLGLFSHYHMNSHEMKIAKPDHRHSDHALSLHGDKYSGLISDHASVKFQHAFELLSKKWIKSAKDPIYFADDIQSMAAYIAARPEAFELLMSLKNQPWSIHFKAGDFRTEVKGSRFTVNRVKVYFDSRSAAVFASHAACDEDARQCIASPVDGFLHELLHVKLALTETEEFIRMGGMNPTVYPHRHEREVISLERKIYQAMSARDQQPRPSRRSHAGQLIAASCVTCVGV